MGRCRNGRGTVCSSRWLNQAGTGEAGEWLPACLPDLLARALEDAGACGLHGVGEDEEARHAGRALRQRDHGRVLCMTQAGSRGQGGREWGSE